MVPEGVRMQALAKIKNTFDALRTVTKAIQGASPETVWKQMQQRSVVSSSRKKNTEDNLMPLVASLIERTMTVQVLDGLHNILVHDESTFNHSVNVCVVSIKIA